MGKRSLRKKIGSRHLAVTPSAAPVIRAIARLEEVIKVMPGEIKQSGKGRSLEFESLSDEILRIRVKGERAICCFGVKTRVVKRGEEGASLHQMIAEEARRVFGPDSPCRRKQRKEERIE